MLKKFLSAVVLLFIFIAIGLAHGKLFGYSWFEKSSDIVTEKMQEAAKQIYPQLSRIEKAGDAKFAAYDVNNQFLGNLLLSSPAADNISGFGGAVPLLIGVTAQGKIDNLVMLPNGETPDYAEKVQNSGFLKLWNGLEMAAAAEKQIDAVSGATLTSTAVKNTLKATLQAELGNKATIKTDYSVRVKNLLLVGILGLALFAFRNPQYGSKLRLAVLVLSLVVLGIWQGTMLSVTTFAAWLVNGIPLAGQWGLALIFAFAVLIPIFCGKSFYCYYVCPFGAVQELAGRLRRKKISIPLRLMKILVHLRCVMLLAVMIVLLLGAGIDVSYFEPFSAFRPQSASWAAVGIAAISFVLAIFINRPWCRFGCPCGEFLDLGRKHKE